MLERLPRTPSAAALRARRSRARLRNGVRTFKVRAHTRRLVAAMCRANPDLGDELEHAAIEAELNAIVDSFITRWIGERSR
jgi:hypothetical protein